MGIVLDIVIMSIFFISIILGYKKGLIGVAFNLCAFLIAIIITWILYTPITNLVIDKTNFDENIKNSIIEKGAIKIEEKEDTEEKNVINDYLQTYVTVPTTEKTNEAIEQVAGIIGQKAVAIGVAIILFILVRIGLFFMRFLAESIAKLPIIKQCDKIGGIIYGTIVGVFIVYIILAILFVVMSINNSGMVAEMVNSSIISKYLYTNNIILNIIF